MKRDHVWSSLLLFTAMVLLCACSESQSQTMTNGVAHQDSKILAQQMGFSEEVMEHYVSNGKKLPIVSIDGQTAMKLKIAVFLNGEQVAEGNPPRELMFMSTVNEYLQQGENQVEVRYEVVSVAPESAPYGPKTFKVNVTKQTDWNDTASESVLVSIEGPKANTLAVGAKGKKIQTFSFSKS